MNKDGRGSPPSYGKRSMNGLFVLLFSACISANPVRPAAPMQSELTGERVFLARFSHCKCLDL